MHELKLSAGAHSTRQEGMCAMEFIAYLAGEQHSDHPGCVSPVIGAFVRNWNDNLDDDARNRLLRPLLRECLHTNTGPQDDETRAWLAIDWLVRVQAPTWLALAGMIKQATSLKNLQPLTSPEIAMAVQSTIDDARQLSAAATDDAWYASREAAMAAAMDAAWAAARVAATTAATTAATDAAMDAAMDAVTAAAWDAAWDAEWAAAWVHLHPTVQELQASAVGLVCRMIAVGVKPEPSPLNTEAEVMLCHLGL